MLCIIEYRCGYVQALNLNKFKQGAYAVINTLLLKFANTITDFQLVNEGTQLS